MTESEATAECQHCGNPLPTGHRGACPNCGKQGKLTRIKFNVKVHGHASFSLIAIHEFYRTNRWAIFLQIVITIFSFLASLFLAGLLGIALGAILSILSFFIVPIVKVRKEKHYGSSE